jgi:hypothetical protein
MNLAGKWGWAEAEFNASCRCLSATGADRRRDARDFDSVTGLLRYHKNIRALVKRGWVDEAREVAALSSSRRSWRMYLLLDFEMTGP